MTMRMQSFEIRVALLGHVSAGKSTVLNALLQNKCSEVAMRRTTAGVNLFRVHPNGASRKDVEAEDAEASWNPNPDAVTMQSSDQTLRQITDDNQRLRSVNAVQETIFNVQIDEPICDMRKDTTLVLIDIPGLNEAGSQDMYLEYVMNKWDTFDCVIVVKDVVQGVNTEEQVKLLEIVHKNTQESKQIPVIVLCNKVDDPDNKETIGLVKEISQKVHSIFKNQKAIDFIPISAENAFVYRTASRLPLDEFKRLDESLIDKIVYDAVGKLKWRKLTVDERYQTAYDAIHNSSSLEESLTATNFGTFLDAFRRCVEESVQPALIQKQMVVKLKAVTFDDVVALKLRELRDMEVWLGMPPLQHSEHFWSIYDKFHGPYIDAFASSVDHRSLLLVMSQLIAYGEFLHTIGSTDKVELAKVVDSMASLVLKQVRMILEQSEASTWLATSPLATQQLYDWNAALEQWDDVTEIKEVNVHSHSRHHYNSFAGYVGKGVITQPPRNNPHHWRQIDSGWENIYTTEVVSQEHNPVTGPLSWATLSPLDYCTMARSILLLFYSRSFSVRFGREKFLLEKIVSDYNALSLKPSVNERALKVLTEFTICQYNDKDELGPKYPDKYSLVSHIAMHPLLSDPDHWGHVAWQFCEFADVLKE